MLPEAIAHARRALTGAATIGNALGGLAVLAAVGAVAWTWATGEPLLALAIAALVSVAVNVLLAVVLLRTRDAARRPSAAGPGPVDDGPASSHTHDVAPLVPSNAESVPAMPERAAPVLPVWFSVEGDPSSIAMTEGDLNAFAEAADKTVRNQLGPDAKTEFHTFQISVAKGFLPSVNLYFHGFSQTAMKKETIQFALWATTKPGIVSIERLDRFPSGAGTGMLRPWIGDDSWHELLRLAWLAERPFSGEIYIRFRRLRDSTAGSWVCSIDPVVEGVKNPSVEFSLQGGALIRS